MAEYLALVVSFLSFMTASITLATVLIGLNRGVKRDMKIETLALSVDGRLSQLIAMNAKSSFAEGLLEGKADQTPPPAV